jgi:uncharacterized membrane protein YebE (DUF533 family)
MFDPKKLLDELLGSQIPGVGGTVRDKAGEAVQMAKDNPLAAGALAAVLLGTGAGRQATGAAVRLGGGDRQSGLQGLSELQGRQPAGADGHRRRA